MRLEISAGSGRLEQLDVKPDVTETPDFVQYSPFRYTGFVKEDHKHPIFGVAMCPVSSQESAIFATVGSNRATVYQCFSLATMASDRDSVASDLPDTNGDASDTCSTQDESEAGDADSRTGLKLLHCFADPDPDEQFYCAAWSAPRQSESDAQSRPLLAVSGSRGVIRILAPFEDDAIVRHFIGHGQCVNQLEFHYKDFNILLSVSKDHAIRLWNVSTGACIAILGGVEGHRDEVLSANFHISTLTSGEDEWIVSSGMDHALKIWKIGPETKIGASIRRSYDYAGQTARQRSHFETELCHFPDFSTRDIHRNYVDCCQWYGDLIMSKSCENTIVCWQPAKFLNSLNTKLASDDTKADQSDVVIVNHFELADCPIWFVRFALDASHQTMACGNQAGKIHVWTLLKNGNLSTASLKDVTCQVLAHNRCNSAVRQVVFTPDSNTLIAVCDDSSVWRFDRRPVPS